MTAEEPTLTSAKGLGGIIAQEGFDYQVWDALARLPDCLQNPAFEGMILEGLEDVEARFFAPHAPHGHLLERFQAKSGVLTRAGLVEVFNSFYAFEENHPCVARVQTLVTPSLPPNMAWIARDPERVRRARPFYSPFADVAHVSDEKLRNDLSEEFGSHLGHFFASSIEISLRNLPDRTQAEGVFATALNRAFPTLEVSMRRVAKGFSALLDLMAQSRGLMLTRAQLVTVLEDALELQLFPDRKLSIHICSDHNAPGINAIEIDARKFSGNENGFPAPERWLSDLLHPLTATARWARENRYQHIALSGSYRLTTAFALGWAFRSAIGFEIDIPTKQGIWSTNEHPTPDTAPLPWCLTKPRALIDGHLKVGIGIVRDPTADILSTLELQSPTDILSAFLPAPIANGVQAQASVQLLKNALTQAVSQLRPAAIDLYFVGPAAFSVALGHRWNALPLTHFHEFVRGNQCYVPTLTVGN
ncbi:SAVED domain-containing protein [Leptolyngbya sp. PL-A3]|uniref:SAVED domain-containing protein n=1 Tax=Leptolyngbya sp. PL-A3 TaxID=2933911 RepID=UPI0032981607